MSIKHINSMRQAVLKYYDIAKNGREQIKKNNEIYSAEFADPANAKIQAGIDSARWEAEEAIRTAQEAGRAEALAWGELHGADIPDDAKLLQFDITPEQFTGLVERHKSNGTMSVLLAQYAERKNKEAAAADPLGIGRYDLSIIPTAEDKAGVYDRFAIGARDLITRIDRPEGTFGGGTDSTLLKSSVDAFGVPNAFTQQLFDLL